MPFLREMLRFSPSTQHAMLWLSHLAIIAAAGCVWLLWRLLDREDPPELSAAEWIFPLRGRWLRYLLAIFVSALLLVSVASIFVPRGVTSAY